MFVHRLCFFVRINLPCTLFLKKYNIQITSIYLSTKGLSVTQYEIDLLMHVSCYEYDWQLYMYYNLLSHCHPVLPVLFNWGYYQYPNQNLNTKTYIYIINTCFIYLFIWFIIIHSEGIHRKKRMHYIEYTYIHTSASILYLYIFI